MWVIARQMLAVCYWTHLKIVIEERQDDCCEREDEEDAESRERKSDLKDLHYGGEDDRECMTVEDWQE